jgi:hypothetical protein
VVCTICQVSIGWFASCAAAAPGLWQSQTASGSQVRGVWRQQKMHVCSDALCVCRLPIVKFSAHRAIGVGGVASVAGSCSTVQHSAAGHAPLQGSHLGVCISTLCSVCYKSVHACLLYSPGHQKKLQCLCGIMHHCLAGCCMRSDSQLRLFQF